MDIGSGVRGAVFATFGLFAWVGLGIVAGGVGAFVLGAKLVPVLASEDPRSLPADFGADRVR